MKIIKNNIKYVKLIFLLLIALLVMVSLYIGFVRYVERLPKLGKENNFSKSENRDIQNVLENNINKEKDIKINGTNTILQIGSSVSEVNINKNSTDYDKDRKIIEDTKYIRIKLLESFEKNKSYPESISDFLVYKNIENQNFKYRRDETGKKYKLSVKLNTKEGLVVLGGLANNNKENQNIVSFSDLSVVLNEKSGNFFYMPAK